MSKPVSAKTRAKQRAKKLGKLNPNFIAGISHERGYLTVPAPQKGPGGRREYLHRVVTHAPKGTAVHHVDHKRGNDKPGNLQVTTKHPGRKGGQKRKS